MQLGDNAQPKKSWVLSCLDSNLKSGSIPPQPKNTGISSELSSKRLGCWLLKLNPLFSSFEQIISGNCASIGDVAGNKFNQILLERKSVPCSVLVCAHSCALSFVDLLIFLFLASNIRRVRASLRAEPELISLPGPIKGRPFTPGLENFQEIISSRPDPKERILFNCMREQTHQQPGLIGAAY